MSLRPSDFYAYVLASAQFSYGEIYLGESLDAQLSFLTPSGTALNLTGYTFMTEYVDAMGTLGYTGETLTSVTNITLLSPTPQTDTNLVVTNVSALAGTATLTIPTTVTSLPSSAAPIDTANTLIKLIQIKATFNSTAVPTFVNNRKLFLGLIIRWAEA